MTTRKLMIDGVHVDTEALLRLRHDCHPKHCQAGPCCCQVYEITFTQEETTRAIGMMPHCERYAPHLKPGAVLENPFEDEDNEEGDVVVEEQENGACAFAYKDKKGRMWCSIHSAALDLGLRPAEVKAQVCLLWPVALTDDTPPILSIVDDAFDFPCNHRRRKDARRLDPGVAECVERIMGPDFLEALRKQLALRQETSHA
jgi:hypothetical protein